MNSFRLALLLLLPATGVHVHAAVQPQSASPTSLVAPDGARIVASGPAGTAKRQAASKPAWNELTPQEQQALGPLAASWVTLSAAHKRKWIALSQNYPKLPPAEQAKLHSRMTEWVALSPQQRAQARLNFAETQTLAPDDKKAKWEAYQALPPEEKRKLAAGAAVKPPPTAAAVKPVPKQKLAAVPKARNDAKSPRIAAGPAADAGPAGSPALGPSGPN
ncbi:MAG TPA: DUF3106 domain-containing protein [Ramlibacter sp.]|nr:DUF3106 domain-containing protein [Ramlibacter sp.]